MAYIYRQDHIPKSTPYNRRPSNRLGATTITIHTTGNPTSTAANERAWLTNPTNTRTASYHIVVDEKDVIEVLPLNENAWHSGDGSSSKSGNRTSIGIEICERNYEKSLENAIELIVKMLKERNWGIDKLRRHFDWSGKQCPRMMNTDGKWTGWYDFLKRVESKLKENTDKKVTVIVNGKQLQAQGFLINNLTHVPLRAIGEAIGAKVIWKPETQDASINGQVVDGFVISGSTYVPLRVLANTIGATVIWDQKSYTATFNT